MKKSSYNLFLLAQSVIQVKKRRCQQILVNILRLFQVWRTHKAETRWLLCVL